MANIGESVAVIDKSGKLVRTGKHLFGVFSHAKNAYYERKAQVISERNAKIAEREALKALQAYTIDDIPSTTSSRRRRGTHSHHSSRKYHHRDHDTLEDEQDLPSPTSRPEPSYYAPQAMTRQAFYDTPVRTSRQHPVINRPMSDACVDMDLAYGEFHPSEFSERPRQLQKVEDEELDNLVSRVEWLLEEANCLQYTAATTISHLQKNPDAMAAVALTLAEISNLAMKMAPAALSAFKISAPVVWALLASPQFLIAAGVGLGATVVAFGGYKIIKYIQSPRNEEAAKTTNIEDMVELNSEYLSHVERWRRGVADAEAESVCTSVEGEFITPTAAAMSKLDVSATGRSRRDQSRPEDNYSNPSLHSSRRSRTHRSNRNSSDIDMKSEVHTTKARTDDSISSELNWNLFSRSSKPTSKASSRSSGRRKTKPSERKREPSRLRHLLMPL